ncbi:MAG: sigma-54 dependent transcriptional regulator [Acidobacteriota bacterium]
MILIADDDPSVVASLTLLLKQHGRDAVGARNASEAAARARDQTVELVLQDLNFSRATSGREGLALLAEIKAARPDLPVILITAWGSIALAVDGVKAGAADFITKPWSNAQLLRSVDTALSLAAAHADEASAKRCRPIERAEIDKQGDFSGLLGTDPKFLRVLELVGRIAPTDASVLITGESGTGKELIAGALHKNSPRRARPFVKVNLGGISSTLFESEMFGHVRGAFTDARDNRQGRFEIADGGTIFLDEIGEVDPSAQVKLLRVLQDRTYEPLGSSTSRTVDARVISATNRDLPALVQRGEFREDLLYRLNLIVLRLPALRERRGDIPLLAGHFLAAAARVYRKPAMTLSDPAAAWLASRPWPGNVRQLKQTVERAVLVLEHERLETADLEALAALEDRGDPASTLPTPGSMTLDEIERGMIANCLRHYDGNITHVAEALGLSRAALYRRLEKYGLG